jgi:plasmid stabilization system protein ParE
MTYRVTVLARAETEIETILNWLAERSPRGAARWLDALEATLQTLTDNPHGFGLAAESDLVGYTIRQSFFRTARGRTYRVVFTVVGHDVRILRIRGPGQRPLTADEL